MKTVVDVGTSNKRRKQMARESGTTRIRLGSNTAGHSFRRSRRKRD